MAIKVNARETELKIGKKPGYYYVMTPDLYIALAQKKVIKEAAVLFLFCRSFAVRCTW